MELKNKKIAFLGDSITEGVGVSDPANIYWNRLAAATGAEVYNHAIRGTRIAPQRIPTAFELSADRCFVYRAEEISEDMDLVVIFGGTNDYGHGDAAFGDMNDRSLDTFYGAYHQLVQKLMAKCPKVIVMTPLHREVENSLYNDYGIRRMGSLEDYVNAIRQVAAHYDLPVVDLYAECPIYPADKASREQYAPDGLHPNDAGHELVARMLLDKLKNL